MMTSLYRSLPAPPAAPGIVGPYRLPRSLFRRDSETPVYTSFQGDAAAWADESVRRVRRGASDL